MLGFEKPTLAYLEALLCTLKWLLKKPEVFMKSWQDVLFVLLDLAIDLSRSDKSTYLLGAGLLKNPSREAFFGPPLDFY